MFFRDRVQNVKPGEKVLEIGPGGTPHERADVFLDLDPKLFKDETEAHYQRGAAPKLKTDKPIVYYDGKKFPFKDKEFDYVICSHVLEHVDDIAAFVKEIFRITNKGYFEFPSILYDYIYDIPVHPNFVRFDKETNTLRWLKKADTHFAEFKDVQYFFFKSIEKGHECLVQSLELSMIQGFEWTKPFTVKKATSISQLVPPINKIQKARQLAPLIPPAPAERPVDQIPLEVLTSELKRRAKRRARRHAGRVARKLGVRK
ncbi:MAG: class I SAM-dependent methyltransferase [Candidatus Saccharibacteria bacterium]|nr:class I SAM-dependent methyltransferase [Candidatus Saccharibacteria bacterium]